MTSKWDKLAAEASAASKAELAKEISSLSSLNDSEINRIITETGISNEDFVAVLQTVRNATKSNQSKAEAIKNINKGVGALIEIVRKLL